MNIYLLERFYVQQRIYDVVEALIVECFGWVGDFKGSFLELLVLERFRKGFEVFV